MNENRDSIMRMARGAFEERVDYEMDKVIQNILDPNTKATAKRKITLTIELTPDDERRQIQVSVTAKSTLAAYENTGLEPWEIGPAIEKAAKDAETATATKMAECIAGGIKDTVDAIHRDPDGFFKGGAR